MIDPIHTFLINQSFSSYRGHIVRLNSIEPNTVMFSTKDYPILSDVSVPEIIDELERQFDAKLCEVQGVRQAGSKIFICLSQRESLSHLGKKMETGFFFNDWEDWGRNENNPMHCNM